jgi:hypothetical protein
MNQKAFVALSNKHMLQAIENSVVNVVENCIGTRGFTLPVFIVGASADGCVFAARFERTSRGVETVPLTFRRSGEAFQFPINLMVCDSAASVPAQAVIREAKGPPEFVH